MGDLVKTLFEKTSSLGQVNVKFDQYVIFWRVLVLIQVPSLRSADKHTPVLKLKQFLL